MGLLPAIPLHPPRVCVVPMCLCYTRAPSEIVQWTVMSFFMPHLRIFSPLLAILSQQKAEQKSLFRDYFQSIFFSLLFFHPQQDQRLFMYFPWWYVPVGALKKRNPAITTLRLTPPSHTRKKFVLSLGLGYAENVGLGCESDMLHEFRFFQPPPTTANIAHSKAHRCFNMASRTFRRGRRVEAEHDNGHVVVLESGD